ncbi:LemA family protein [Candidatus Woesearchaeota archaeon]|nr:LemA family protein [Candidatus Woesearchaeota archaeon]
MDNKIKGLSKKWWIVIGVIAIILIYLIAVYNNFVTLNQNINGKWSEVENQYQRQADLIPNLVSIVSSSLGAETKFVKDVVDARTAWQNAQSQFDKDKAGFQMNGGIAALVNAVAENYPTLQANKQYVALTDEVSGTQNRITVARGNYISAIQLYNTAILRFPARLAAGMFGFSGKDYYKAEQGALTTPKLGTGLLP